MTIEIVNYIKDLDPDNPKGSDKIAEGDNHVRNIKYALKESFPNIDGQVLATPDELNQLVGLTELVPPALPEVPTEEGSMLANANSKWSETTTIKIVGDKAFIPAFAGLGNINLYVNNAGEIVATDMANDPSLQHDLNFHTDVDFEGTPERDDVLIHDGTAWRAKRYEGGNTMNPIMQPKTAGNFSSFQSPGEWQTSATSSNETKKFTIPAGMKFHLVDIQVIASFEGQYYNVISVPNNSIIVDGVRVYDGWGGSITNGGLNNQIGYAFGGENGKNDPMWQVKNELQMTVNGDTGCRCVVVGYFVEDK